MKLMSEVSGCHTDKATGINSTIVKILNFTKEAISEHLCKICVICPLQQVYFQKL